MRVAVDAMGGDNVPDVIIEGAIRATEKIDDLEILLVGPEGQVKPVLKEHLGGRRLPIKPVHASEVIDMAEAPAAAVKRKRDSSIHVGLGAHSKGKADAFVSAGNTGAIMAASLFILDRLPGVERPSVIGYVPTSRGMSILLDVGTNVDCKPEHLVQFAHMGSIYAEQILERDEPVVALLNIGEEPGKGNEQVKKAYKLLEKVDSLNFSGNIEGREMMQGAADVIVCDGFVGNIILKMGEEMGTNLLSKLVHDQMKALNLNDAERKAVSKVMKGVQEPFDYETRGGVPLLGVAGNVIIGHGSSTSRAFERMIETAYEVAQEDVAGAIEHAIGN